MMHARSARWLVVFGVPLVLLSLSIPVCAQLPTGTILGVVKDTSGAVVPDATVTATQVETGRTRTVTSAVDGNFRISALPVGSYNVRFEKTGFSTQTQQGVVLTVSQELVVNSILEVGTTSQEVTVTGELSLVNTTNASLGGLVTEQKMTELPLNGRNYVDLAFLQPGIAQNKTQSSTSAPSGTIYSSNGAPSRSNNYLLDGAPLQTLQGYGGASAGLTQLGVDGIREYKVVTNTFGAEYGMTMGSQMTLVSKGGTNQFHGTLFEYLRNAALDARNYFDYSYQVTGKRVPQYQRNNFGASFGGPIRKNKLFFFGVYEGLRQTKVTPTVLNVLAPGCHGPAGTVLTNAVCPQLQLPSNVPSVTIAPVAEAYIGQYSLPNLPDNQFYFGFAQPTRVDYGQMRVDQIFSDSDTFFARYTSEKASLLKVTSGPDYQDSHESWNQYVSASESHVFSPTLLNTARLSYSRTSFTSISIAPNDPRLITVPGETLPGSYSVPGLTGLGSSTLTPVFLTQNVYSFGDDVFHTRGNHALKMGILVNRVEPAMEQASRWRGQVTFGSLRNFMTGRYQAYQVAKTGNISKRFYRWHTVGLYAQDDWRVAQRLTLNLGLRYEFNTTVTEQDGRGYSLRNPATDTQTTPGPELRNASLKNFSPRFGFAWDIFGSGSMSVRGGVGLYYDVAQVASGLTGQSNGLPPLAGLTNVTAPSGQTLPFTVPLLVPPGVPEGKDLRQFNYFSDQPKLLQMNLTVDRQLPGGIVAGIGYVGTRGYDLFRMIDGNPCIPTTVDANGPFWASNCGQGRVNPTWASIGYTTSDSQSWYDALQFTVNKRVTKGLEFQSSYTWAKMLDLGQGQINQDRTTGSSGGTAFYAGEVGGRLYDKGYSSVGDLRHNWRFNTRYRFPNIPSQHFAARLLHGWWMGNIVALQTGYPISPLTTGTRSRSQVDGNQSDRTNLSPTYDPDRVILGRVDHWFDPSMFELQPAGRLGNSGRGVLRGPGFANWDMSLNKDTRLGFLGEAGTLQFRAEFFNILNRANFSLPDNVVFNTAGNIPTTAGQITSVATDPRDIQLALKIIF